jgi:hypothetical protein
MAEIWEKGIFLTQISSKSYETPLFLLIILPVKPPESNSFLALNPTDLCSSRAVLASLKIKITKSFLKEY